MLYTPKTVFWFYYVLVNLDVPDILKDIIAELFFVPLSIYGALKMVNFVCLGKRRGLFLITEHTPPTHPLLDKRMIKLK